MRFDLLEAELSGDLPDPEAVVRPKRARRGKPAPEPATGPGLALLPAVEGPGRYACLGWDEPVTLKAARYVDPDGRVRYRAHLPGGSYVVVLEREATEDELAEAAAQAVKERAR